MKESSDNKGEDSTDPKSKQLAGDSKEEEKNSILLKSVEQVLENLRKSSILAQENNSELDDDERETKLKTIPPEVKNSQPRQRASQFIPKMITDDIGRAYQASKMKQKEGQNDQNQETSTSEKIPHRYDLGQASLMGAVLGIGERDKSKDGTKKRTSPSIHSKIGTLAGLGDITDEDADLSESNHGSLRNKSDAQKFEKEDVESPQINDCSMVTKDIRNQEQEKPSTSHKHLQNAEDSDITDKDTDISKINHGSLRNKSDPQTFEKKDVEKPQINDNSIVTKDIRHQEQDEPTRSHKHLQNAEDCDKTDEDTDLSKNNHGSLRNKSDTQTFEKEDVGRPQINGSSIVTKDIRNQKQEEPSTSHKHLQGAEDSEKSEKSGQAGGLMMRIVRSVKKKLFNED